MRLALLRYSFSTTYCHPTQPPRNNQTKKNKTSLPLPVLFSPYAWRIPGEENRLEPPPPLLGVVPVLRPTKVGRRRSQGEGGTRPIVTPRRPQGVASREDGQDPLSSLTVRAILSSLQLFKGIHTHTRRVARWREGVFDG